MYDLLAPLRETLASGRQAAWCRLVETRGSTPQKAGAAMLVFADGSQAGTLGGGCVEAEVKRRALAAIVDGRPRIDRFNLDSDYGWDDGLICGGRMQILIQPIHSGDSQRYFRRLAGLLETSVHNGCTEVVRFESSAEEGSAPAGYLFDGEGVLIAAWPEDAGEVEQIAAELKPLSIRPAPYAVRGVAFLPVLPRCRLVIVGGGHVGQAVASLAADLDFNVWVVDDRAEVVSAERFPRAARRVVGDIGQTLPELEITGDTYCLIVTRGHNHDEEALSLLIDRGARYVGLIGSRRKIKLIFDDLRAQGVSAESLEEVYAPLGIDIGSQTVPEIAVSICAELVSHRNRGGMVPGRPERISVMK
jgi:xanthine dehydrogenase accessory factor